MSERNLALGHLSLITPFALIRGTPGPDDLETLADGDSLFGLAGADRLFSIHNFTHLDGGADDDVITTDIAFADDGTVQVRQFGDSGNDTLLGRVRLVNDPNEPLYVADVQMRLSGGLGDDAITAEVLSESGGGGVMDTTLLGGEGADEIMATLRTPLGGAPLADMWTRLYGGAGSDVISADVQAYSFGDGFATTRIWGEGGDDVIDAQTEANGLRAAAANEIWAGEGDDRVTAFTDAGTNVGRTVQNNAVWGGTGRDRIDVGHTYGFNNSSAIDNLVWGGDGRDTVEAWIEDVGREQYLLVATNALSGGSGNDTLSARIASNVYSDFTLKNWLTGGSGDDDLRAEIAVTFQSGEANLLTSRNLLHGGTGNDRLTVVGGLANVLNGGRGADVMTGGEGNDTYHVDSYLDQTMEAPGALGGTDQVISWVNHRLSAGIENLTLLAAVRGVGNEAVNVLTGSAGDNRLVGLGGGDRLIGGGGTDQLEGGAGADTIVVDLRPGRTGVLTLADFARTADILEFVGLEDEGAPGLLDDLDAMADFDDAGAGGLLEISIGGVDLRLPGRGTGAVDSFADIVANSTMQLVAGDLLV